MSDGRILTVGSAASDLDIYLTAGQNGAAVNANRITFRIFDPAGTEAVTETEGFYESTGRYSASGVNIPAGYTLGESWQIKWDVVLPGGASGSFQEFFEVASPQLSASFANPTGNSVESIFDRVRLDLGDPDAMIFTDGLMRRTLKKAISRVNRRLGLVKIDNQSSWVYLIAFTSRIQTPVLELDLLAGTVSPDTDPYVDILVLQMEEILLQSESVALGRLNQHTAGSFGSGLQGIGSEGVAVTNADGVSINKSGGRLQVRKDMMKFNVENIQGQLESAIKELRYRLSSASGRDVTMPRYGYGRGGYGPNGYGRW